MRQAATLGSSLVVGVDPAEPPSALRFAHLSMAWWPEGLWNAFHVPSLDVMRSRRGD